jgi:hypothetical protein
VAATALESKISFTQGLIKDVAEKNIAAVTAILVMHF